MTTELFTANLAATTVTSGGTGAPASGTSETWTVASSAMFGTAATGVSQFHVSDPAAPSEMIAVTSVSGTTWTVTRGAESTVPVGHTGGFTVCQVTTAGFLAGAAAAVATGISAAAYGVVGDHATDCTTALQNAVNAALATQQGTAIVDLPPGAVVISGTISCSSATDSAAGKGVYFRGSGRGGSQILKANGFTSGPSLSWKGYGGPSGFPSSYGGLIDVAIEGHFLAGGAVELDSCQQMYFRGAAINSVSGTALTLNTVQDTYFSQCTLSSIGSTSAPGVLITGSSGGISNMVWFSQCRFESFLNGAVWINLGSGQTSANAGFFFSQCKFETATVNGDLIVADTWTQQLVMSQVFLSADSFNSGYSTPCNGITYGNGATGAGLNQASFRDVSMHAASGVANSVIAINGTNMNGPVTVDSLEFDSTPVSGSLVATSGTMTSVVLIQSNVRNGSANITVPFDMGGRKITSLANGSASTDAAAFGQIPVPLPAFTTKSGAYVQGQGGVSTSATLGNGVLRLTPFIAGEACTVAAIGAEFTAAGDAASLFRMAIYADDGTFYPGAVLLDGGGISTGTGNAGTVSTGGTAGVYMNAGITPQALSAGAVYWIGGAVQGVSVTQPTMRTGYFTLGGIAVNTVPGAGATAFGYQQGSVTGALPSTFEAFTLSSPVASVPRVVIKLQ